MRRRRPLVTFVAFAALIISQLAGATTPAAAAPQTATLPKPQAQIVVDASNGHILIADNIHKAMHPASTAKIMTALAAVERLPPDGKVTTDAYAANVEANEIGLVNGERWPLNEMLAALMMESANDAAYALAYTAGGSLEGFNKILNDTARRLGLHDSTLNDPAGLDTAASFKGGPYMSAYDLAIATRDALSVDAIAKWAGTATYDFTDPTGQAHHLKNHNKMVLEGTYKYAGATGFKTGFTDRAQHSLVATATRNGRTLIAIILGAADGGYTTAASLLDAGFAMPANAAGVDKPLPANHVSLYAARAADRDGWRRLANAAPPTNAAGTPIAVTTVPALIPSLSSPAPVAKTRTIVARHNPKVPMPPLRLTLIVVGALVLIALLLRRRAVKRQRAMRAARRRQRLAAMRSGGLPVVDGRYRPGLRLGPPLESHVRVRHIREPGNGNGNGDGTNGRGRRESNYDALEA